MGPKWVFIWVLYGHKGLMRDLPQVSMLDPHWQSNMGTIWELYGFSMGKINPHLSSRKILLHIFTQMILSPVRAHLMDR